MTQSGPLPKTVLNVDTTKGINELVRGELLTQGFLTAQNVVQNRQGAWVKRPGQVAMASLDDLSENLYQPRLLFQTNNSMGALANPQSTDGSSAGKWCYAYSNAAQRFYRQNRGGEFGVKQWETIGEDCDDFSVGDYCVAYVKSYLSFWILWLVDRTTGNVIRTYRTQHSSTGNGNKIVRCGHAGGLYLHIYIVNIGAGPFSQRCFQVDTSFPPAPSPTGLAPGTVYNAGDALTTDFEITNRWSKCWSGPTRTVMIQPYGNTFAQCRVTTMDSSGTPVSASLNGESGCPTSAGNVIMAVRGVGVVNLQRYVQSTLAATGGVAQLGKAFSQAGEMCHRIVCDDVSETNVCVYTAFPHTATTDGTFGVFHRCSALVYGSLVAGTISGYHAYGTTVGGYELYWMPDLAYYPETKRFYALLRRGNSDGSVPGVPTAGNTSLSAVTNSLFKDTDGRLFLLDVSEAYATVYYPRTAAISLLWYRARVAGVIGHTLVKGVTKFDTSAGLAVPYIAHTRQASAGSYLTVLTELNWHFSDYNAATTSFGAVLGGASVETHDGEELHEAQLVDKPSISKMTLTANASGVAPGVYQYYVVHRFVDAAGNQIQSETAGPYAANISAASFVNFEVNLPSLTSYQAGVGVQDRIITELYRTGVNGTVPYLQCQSSVAAPGGGSIFAITNGQGFNDSSLGPCVPVYTFQDTAAAGTGLTSRKKLYRLAGNPGAALNRGCAPPTVHVSAHQDRLFCVDATGKRVYFSSFQVDGEGPWWNPAFVLTPNGGSGRITGCASMEGRLLIFKEDALFVVDGAGPPEGGGNGYDFQPPVKIADVGAVSGRSIVSTPFGVYFRSKRGVELIGKNFQVEFVGKPVLDETEAHRGTQYAIYDAVNDRVMFGLSDTVSYVGSVDGGVCIVMDLRTQCWSTWLIYNFSAGGTYFGGAHAVVAKLAEVPVSQGGEAPVIMDSQYFFWRMDSDKGMDSGSVNVDTKLVTPWLKAQGPEGRNRFFDLAALFAVKDKSNVKMSLAYNYNPTPSQTRTFTDTEIAALVGPSQGKQLVIQPATEAVTAIQLTIEDIDASTGPSTTYRGIELFGISAEMAPKQGITKLPKENKA